MSTQQLLAKNLQVSTKQKVCLGVAVENNAQLCSPPSQCTLSHHPKISPKLSLQICVHTLYTICACYSVYCIDV